MPDDDAIPLFVPVSQYDHPVMPTEEWLKRIVGQLRQHVFSRDDAAPVLAETQLLRAEPDRLDSLAPQPVCRPLLREMSATFADWLDDEGTGQRLHLVILPPCDTNQTVSSWAERHDLEVLAPPDRPAILSDVDVTIPDLDGDGVLVIPELERWFLRHRLGLQPVRALLQALSRTDRRCLIGCNSWAWAFLRKATGIDLQCPSGQTFRAFDAQRLHGWFQEVAGGQDERADVFRLSKTGEDVFATNENGIPKSDFFEQLAANSRGIPWVAWHLWRRSLRKWPESEDGVPEEAREDEATLWIAPLDSFTLPRGHERSAALVLQSLLIHGPLDIAALHRTLPFVSDTNIVAALLSAGLLRRENDSVACVPAAYPDIRRALAGAGYPMDGF